MSFQASNIKKLSGHFIGDEGLHEQERKESKVIFGWFIFLKMLTLRMRIAIFVALIHTICRKKDSILCFVYHILAVVPVVLLY